MTFLRYYVLFESSEFNTIFDTELKELTERSETMGIEELMLDRAKKQGIQKGKKAGERNQTIAIAREFKKLGLPIEEISKGTGLSIEVIEKL